MHVLTEKVITVRGVSRIGDRDVAMFDAVVNSVNPLNVTINTYATDEETYKSNLEQCRQDENDFRSYVRDLQDEMISSE